MQTDKREGGDEEEMRRKGVQHADSRTGQCTDMFEEYKATRLFCVVQGECD